MKSKQRTGACRAGSDSPRTNLLDLQAADHPEAVAIPSPRLWRESPPSLRSRPNGRGAEARKLSAPHGRKRALRMRERKAPRVPSSYCRRGRSASARESDDRASATALASLAPLRSLKAVSASFSPFGARPTEEFPPFHLRSELQHTTYSWPHACEIHCDLNHTARRTPHVATRSNHDHRSRLSLLHRRWIRVPADVEEHQGRVCLPALRSRRALTLDMQLPPMSAATSLRAEQEGSPNAQMRSSEAWARTRGFPPNAPGRSSNSAGGQPRSPHEAAPPFRNPAA